MIGIVEIIVFLCIAGYFFNKNRDSDMVDIISNRLQEAYGNFRIPGFASNTNNEQQENQGYATSVSYLRRYGQEGKRKRTAENENNLKMREKSLSQIKESPSNILLPPAQTVQGLSCKHCMPANAESQIDPIERRRDVTDILRVTQHAGRRFNSSIFDWGIYFPHMAQVFRLYRFPYLQVSGMVLQDERMKLSLEQATNDSIREKRDQMSDEENKNFDEDQYYNEIYRKHEKRAFNILLDMRSKISDVLLRITSWVLYKLLPCFLSGVAAHPAQIEMLKAATEKAPNAPLIFLPLHRSHLDYILISFILLNNDIRSPIVAAGNNLRIPFFGALLRGLGAFFIKRKIDPLTGKKDIIYRGVLHTYLQKCLAAGHNVEFFIEGGRTRTGKPCMPKSGILSVIVDAFMDGTISDALLVPVSVNYEKLVDGNFVHEQLGQKKKPESFRSAISAIWNILNSQYGLMRIDFNEPFSLGALVKTFNKTPDIIQRDISTRRLQHNPSSSSLYGTDVVQEEHRNLVDSIARHVIYDCSNATAVMTTNALAFLLLNRFRDGATLSVLIEAMDELRRTIEGKRDIGFTGTSEAAIMYATKLLGPGLVSQETRLGQQIYIKPITLIPNVIELAYYSNTLIPHFVLDSILTICANYLIKKREIENKILNKMDEVNSVDLNNLIRESLGFCDMLRYEFMLCKPCQVMENLLQDTLDRLALTNILAQPVKTEYTETEDRARRLANAISYDNDFSDDDDEDEDGFIHRNNNNIGYNEDQNVFLPSETHCDRIVLMSVLAPIAETYLACALTLNCLIGLNSMVEIEFVKLAVKKITSRVENGDCKYGESISVDSIRNCIKLLEKWSILDISNSTGVRLISLCSVHDSEIGVQNVIQRIQKYVPKN